jgi:hypothetical protein
VLVTVLLLTYVSQAATLPLAGLTAADCFVPQSTTSRTMAEVHQEDTSDDP